jgi:hypothetical protein
MLYTCVSPFHNVHYAIQQFLILNIDIALTRSLCLVVNFINVRKSAWRTLVDVLLHVNHLADKVTMVLGLDQDRGDVLFIIDTVFLLLDHFIYFITYLVS